MKTEALLVAFVTSVDAPYSVDEFDVAKPVAERPKTTACDVTTALVSIDERLVGGRNDFHANDLHVVNCLSVKPLAASSSKIWRGTLPFPVLPKV